MFVINSEALIVGEFPPKSPVSLSISVANLGDLFLDCYLVYCTWGFWVGISSSSY